MDSPAKTLRRPRSIMDLGTSVADSLRAALFDNAASPSNVIRVLSSTLLVLRIYSVNPAFIIQIFSQVFVWLAAETFNRIMSSVSGKRYQCRSKAMQIRVNLGAVTEWVNVQGVLPGDIFRKQFQRVNQLLQVSVGELSSSSSRLTLELRVQWLQCSSQIADSHVMISTIQHLPDVTPLQLQRAVRDYRYEVGETRISQACLQHLVQLQREWEHRRVKTSIDRIQRQVEARKAIRRYAGGAYSDEEADGEDTGGTPDVNSIFDSTMNLNQYNLALPAQSSSEFEDSRYMLPLSLPRNALLPAFLSAPVASDVPGTPPDVGNPTQRPVSASSTVQPLQYTVRRPSDLRRLPDDFVDWLQKSEAQDISSGRLLRSVSSPNGIEDSRPHLPESVSVPIATPERALRKTSTSDHIYGQKEGSPVTPAFAHHALGIRAATNTSKDNLDRPIRLRQLSSSSNGPSFDDRGDASMQAVSPTAGPESPLRHRSAQNGNTSALGGLRQKFWSPRTRQASDVSRDGYVDSSDDDQDFRN